MFQGHSTFKQTLKHWPCALRGTVAICMHVCSEIWIRTVIQITKVPFLKIWMNLWEYTMCKLSSSSWRGCTRGKLASTQLPITQYCNFRCSTNEAWLV